MANLSEKYINTNGEYQKLETLLGITFTNNKTYFIQVANECKLCELNTLPTSGGFTVNASIPQIIYKKENGKDLYIKTPLSPVLVNVADGTL